MTIGSTERYARPRLLLNKRLSSLVREIISEKLHKKAEALPVDPIFGIVGMASGDGTSVAEKHDDILYGNRL